METKKLSQEIIRLIGGVENINSITNCVTRLRFDLKDKGIAQAEAIKDLNGVVDVVTNDNSYQIVVGTYVSELYLEMVKTIDLSNDSEFGEIMQNKEKNKQANSLNNKMFQKTSISKVTTGKVIPLGEVNDAAFASGVLGKGIAIVPNGKQVSIFAPVSGKVITVFPTKHAYGIQTENGIDILIHLGVDTVNLEGKFFENCVEQGDTVKQGDLIAKFDAEKVMKANYDTTVIVVVTNSGEFLDVVPAGEQSEELLYVVMA